MYTCTCNILCGITFSDMNDVCCLSGCREGCNVLIFPGAFNLTTGEAHWELIQRARAIDNEVYIATCSPAREMQATYNAWGYSMVSTVKSSPK